MLFPYRVAEKLFPFGEELQGKLTKNRAIARTRLSLTSHSRHMEPTKPMKTLLVVLGLAMCACWALLIWIATVVTDTMLRVLAYIVELAQMS